MWGNEIMTQWHYWLIQSLKESKVMKRIGAKLDIYTNFFEVSSSSSQKLL